MSFDNDQYLRSMEGEVFEYGVGSPPRFPGNGMFGTLHLPESTGAEEVIEAIADSSRELDGYGVATSFHGMETYDAVDHSLNDNKPLFGKVSATKLQNQDPDTEVLTPNQYFEDSLKGDRSVKAITDDWNFYVGLDGQVSQVIIDEYRQGLGTEEANAVFDSVFESVYDKLDYGGKDTPDVDQSSDCSANAFPHLFRSWSDFHSFVELPESVNPQETVNALLKTAKQIDDCELRERSNGTKSYIFQEEGDIWVGRSRPLYHSIELKTEKNEEIFQEFEESMADGSIEMSNTKSNTEPDDGWTFIVSYDGDSSGFYAKNRIFGGSKDLLDIVVDGVKEELNQF